MDLDSSDAIETNSAKPPPYRRNVPQSAAASKQQVGLPTRMVLECEMTHLPFFEGEAYRGSVFGLLQFRRRREKQNAYSSATVDSTGRRT